MLFSLIISSQINNPIVDDNTFSNSIWFILLTTIIIPTLMWLFSPQDIKNTVKDFITRNKVDKNTLSENIKKLHLGIVNERQLSIDEFVDKFRYVFFPVVPNKTPNVIHITFINAIKGLEKLGLHVYVFIYDDYFCKVKGYNLQERKTYITNFVKSLQKMGIHKRQILFESDFVKKGRKAKKIISEMYSITSKLSIKEANDLSVINGHYLGNESKYIRKFKSILNMIYPNCISSKIGFVLSGKDEQKLWETYNFDIDSNIVNLYIDALYTVSGGLSNVLDSEILSCEDSLNEIKEKVLKLLNDNNAYNENCSIFYLLKHNFFIYNKTISFIQQNGTSLEITTINSLIDYCKNQLKKGGIEANTVDIIAEIAFKIFHPKKGDNF